MNRKRRIKDFLMNAMTYSSAIITAGLLLLVFSFIFSKGASSLSFDLLKSDYWAQNTLIQIEGGCGSFEKPENYDGAFSECYGLGLKDAVSSDKKKLVVVDYVDEKSPFALGTIMTAGPTKGKISGVEVGHQIERIETREGSLGMVVNQDAQTVVEGLQTRQALSVFYKTAGGGIKGSLIATLQLIAITLLIALPIGVGAAIYLEEIATASRINRMIASGIEMLAGIPSIIFGLMGVVILFPITALFNIDGLSILLGSLTMAVLLFPVIIRSVQEALINVPQAYRLSSLSLGANETQTIFKVVLPSALPGIITSVLLSISRIIGESAALIYTMGTFINDSPSLGKGATSLAVQIWSIMGTEQPNFELAAAISIIILIVVLILNISLKLVASSYRRKLGLN